MSSERKRYKVLPSRDAPITVIGSARCGIVNFRPNRQSRSEIKFDNYVPPYGCPPYYRLYTTAMSPLSCQSYVFDPRPNFPLLLTAKRYYDPSSPHLMDPIAFTLIFGHATGFHKEHYEPTIEDLYGLIRDTGSHSSPKIREVWSIDCPNHGDAAVLNEDTLRRGYYPICAA
jgi:hypothetical protein